MFIWTALTPICRFINGASFTSLSFSSWTKSSSIFSSKLLLTIALSSIPFFNWWKINHILYKLWNQNYKKRISLCLKTKECACPKFLREMLTMNLGWYEYSAPRAMEKYYFEKLIAKVNRDRYNMVDAPSGSWLFFHYCWKSIKCS